MKALPEIMNENILKWVLGWKEGSNNLAWSVNGSCSDDLIMVTKGAVAYVIPARQLYVKLPEERKNNRLTLNTFVDDSQQYQQIDTNKRVIFYNGHKRGEFIPIVNNLYMDAAFMKLFPDCTFWWCDVDNHAIKVMFGEAVVGVIMMTKGGDCA